MMSVIQEKADPAVRGMTAPSTTPSRPAGQRAGIPRPSSPPGKYVSNGREDKQSASRRSGGGGNQQMKNNVNRCEEDETERQRICEAEACGIMGADGY